MSQLPVDQQQVLAKVYMEGKSHQQASIDLGLPLGTVKSRVRLALSKLEVIMRRTL
jgi:RNA polymerase sigma-70 factor (ECF subfamily)